MKIWILVAHGRFGGFTFYYDRTKNRDPRFRIKRITDEENNGQSHEKRHDPFVKKLRIVKLKEALRNTEIKKKQENAHFQICGGKFGNNCERFVFTVSILL